MKSQKYLNCVLTVIAVCLVLLTLSVLGVIPKASASSSAKFATVPVNADGSINVRMDTSRIIPVNIVRLNSTSIPVVLGTAVLPSYVVNTVKVSN
jgi:hypothetical protein